MEHMNYCRQIAMIAQAKAREPSLSEAEQKMVPLLMELCADSHKFLLPFGGKLLDDIELRALDESIPLRLPYPQIAMEFRELLRNDDGYTEARRVVFCFEGDEGIYVWPFAWRTENGFWETNFSAFKLPKVGYLDRTDPKEVCFYASLVGQDIDDKEGASHDVATLLGLCNALACSNVRIERSEPKKFGKKIKSARPFDTYHVLTIDVPGKSGKGAATGSHCSPREHLRRGHIRCLGDGRRIWVNATVVSAGRGAGVVTKDYAVRCAA